MIELALIAVTALGGLGGEGSLRGTILSDRDEPVAGVQVELPSQNRVVWSDAEGRYELAGLEPGEYEVRFTRFAYDPLILMVTVPAGGALDIDVRLRTRFVVQPGISVLASVAPTRFVQRFHPSGLPEVGSREIPIDAVWSSPLVGQPDALATLRTVAGIDIAEENPTQIHVRGGSADQNLLLLDGAPVYNGTHTSGILGPVSPDALSSVVVHTGVQPARYGGRLSSVVDLRTRPAVNRVEVRGGLGVPDARLAIGAPLGSGAGLLLSGRRTTYDLVRRGYARGVEASGFEDLVGKVEFGLLGGTVSAVALHTDNWHSSSAGERPDGSAFPDLHNSVGWSGGTDAFGWRRAADDGSEVEVRVFRAASRSNVEWGSPAERSRMHARLVHWGLSGERTWRGATTEGRVGVAVERIETAYRAGAAGEPVYSLEARPAILASWVERRWIPRDGWLVNGGLRAVHVERADLALEPRISAHVRTGDGFTVSFGYGRTHQALHSLTNEESLLNAAFAVEPLAAVGADGIPLARSDQLAAGFESRLSDRWRLAVDGYLRWLEDLVLVAPATAQPYAMDGFERGRGSSRGIGAELAYTGPRLDARALAAWSMATRRAGDVSYHPRLERPRSLAVEAAYRVFPGTTVSSVFQVAAGRPTSPLAGGFEWEVFDQLTGEVEFQGTPLRAEGELNAERLPPYARLDVGLSREWRVPGRGPEGTLTTYLDVVNVLDHQNVLGYQPAPSGGSSRALALVPRSLLFGVEWHF